MRLAVVFLISLTCCQIALAQKAIKVRSGNEIYYVLESDESIRHGKYLYRLLGLQIEGLYNKGLKVGEWSYKTNGELVHLYDWDNKLMIFNRNKLGDSAKQGEAIFLGGMQAFYSITGQQMRYPSAARQRGIEGQVYFEITITKEGKMTNPTIVSGLGYGCDEETLRVLNSLDLDWIPGKDKSGNPVDVKMKMPMYFKLAN